MTFRKTENKDAKRAACKGERAAHSVKTLAIATPLSSPFRKGTNPYRVIRCQTAVTAPKMANDRIGVALAGCGGRGRGVGNAVAYYGEMVAVCDVDDAQLEIAKTKWPRAKAFKDFRKVMDLKEVDVVVCGTVDHWHTLVSIAAMRAGKDVYCEKPLTITIDEGKHIVKAEKETGRIFQTGTQQRSDARFRLACELARNNVIGPLRIVRPVPPCQV